MSEITYKIKGLIFWKVIKIKLMEDEYSVVINVYDSKYIVVKMKVIKFDAEKYLYIADLYPNVSEKLINKYINKGIGTKMMGILIKFAKEKGYKEIRGQLSKYDQKDHGERLHHFYNKFGFEIIQENNDNVFYASIVKRV